MSHRSRLELKIPPPLVTLATALAMLALAQLVPSLVWPWPGRLLLALLLALTGAAVALAAVLAFGRQHTTVNPTRPQATLAIVSSGIFGWSRNPMYLGMLLALLGWAVWLSHLLAALLPLVFVSYMNRFQIGPEERALSAKFGPEFTQYMARVRRWL